MAPTLFGTDGVRGVANETLTPELAFALAKAGSEFFMAHYGVEQGKMAVGRDTRRSGEMFSGAVIAGITAAGLDVVQMDVVTTPAVAHAAVSDAEVIGGIVISASHNPAEYNGIKFFNGEGFKLRTEEEEAIESQMEVPGRRATGSRIGRVIHGGRYVEAYARHLTEDLGLSNDGLRGLRVVIDGANGAGYRLGPAAFRRAGAEVTAIHCEPTGDNINEGCGSTEPESLVGRVLSGGFDVGFALDGDADRLIAVTPSGRVLDGDDLLYVIVRRLREKRRLRGDRVITTIINNRGLDRTFDAWGVQVHHCAVGDREIMMTMQAEEACVGGETSGHILVSDYATTGDGILNALLVAETLMAFTGDMDDLMEGFEKFPQVVINVPVSRREDLVDDSTIREAVAEAEEQLTDGGRLIVRASGTEPVVRVLVEGPDREIVQSIAESLAQVVKNRLS